MMTFDSSRSDRKKELEDFDPVWPFDATKAGVKGLFDAGATKILKIFVRPTDEIAEDNLNRTLSDAQIPLFDLSQIQNTESRKEIVDGIRAASGEWGFFQLINHGIASSLMESMLNSIRRFNEGDPEVKKQYYSRDRNRKVRQRNNYGVHKASERACQFGPGVAVRSSRAQITAPDRDGVRQVCHYYSECPEPELTWGAKKHRDPSFFTILLQDQIGGLQVLHQDHWICVKPIPGSLVVNIGDFLQVISNKRLMSVEHRVLANRMGPRVSVACFVAGMIGPLEKVYGPIEELVSEESPPLYREFRPSEYVSLYQGKKLLDKSGLDQAFTI
ncbi:1-aminocyclopropane-1-carboxylate oxidase homolog 12-like [Eucalyptus grandis]|uniref:1-aminocyclopropane-1-carboxylate oxidase homolog 12-like n=1 Tax=Eucalyptus grandis TaxID=71139 RepID=UPI00192F0200|nr:1-aminocyclopropane-1-carboxylate oxidase homolog 12-like [Eucalyptus grandis]